MSIFLTYNQNLLRCTENWRDSSKNKFIFATETDKAAYNLDGCKNVIIWYGMPTPLTMATVALTIEKKNEKNNKRWPERMCL